MFKLSYTEGRNQKPPVKPNSHIATAIARASTSQVSADAVMEPNGGTELDSHANMLVVGIHVYILNSSGRTAQVSPFTPEYKSPRVIPEMYDPINATGNAINQQPVYDKMIQAELILPQGDKSLMT